MPRHTLSDVPTATFGQTVALPIPLSDLALFQVADSLYSAIMEHPPPQDETLGLQGFQQPAEAGLSLEQLNAAFAELLGSGDDPYTTAPDEEPTAGDSLVPGLDVPAAPPVSLLGEDDPVEVNPRSILEAMLFVGHPDGRPLTSREIAALMRGVRPAEIDELVAELNANYQASHCPYEIISQGAGYRLQLRAEFNSLKERLANRTRQAKLSAAAVEVLAIVGYHQQVTAEKVALLRGSPSGHLLSQLVRRQLLAVHRVKGQRELEYRTTPRFLELFGLASLDDLPRSDDLDRS